MPTNWPDIPYEPWRETCSALHLYTQIVGKYRLARTPWVNHSWHATLYVSARGFTTSLVPDRGIGVEIVLDLLDHAVIGMASDGRTARFDLAPMSVAAFQKNFKDLLRELGATPEFHGRPNELPEPIPFAEDHADRPYDAEAVSRFFQACVVVDRAARSRKFRRLTIDARQSQNGGDRSAAMKRSIAFLLFSVAAMHLNAGPVRADTFVRCPVPEATSSITNPLPPNWQAIPTTSRLTDTRIVDPAPGEWRARQRLQCVYGQVGVLEFPSPRGEECETRRGGFQCISRRQRPREPRVVAAGTLRLQQTGTADLDTGRASPRFGADIALLADSPFQRFMAPQGGAQLARVGSQPSAADCQRARYGGGRVPLHELVLGGSGLCIVTDEGRFGRLRVISVTVFPVAVEFEFTTWE